MRYGTRIDAEIAHHAQARKRRELETGRENVRRPQMCEDGSQHHVERKHHRGHGSSGEVLAQQDQAAGRGQQDHARNPLRSKPN